MWAGAKTGSGHSAGLAGAGCKRSTIRGMVFATSGCLVYSGDVERITIIINGGKNGLDDRRHRFSLAKPCWSEVSMGIEMIVGLVVAVLAAIAGAFGFGKSRGTTIAETKAEIQRTEERAAATEAVAERRVETTKGARDVQQTVNHLPDDDVDRELREKFTRKT